MSSYINFKVFKQYFSPKQVEDESMWVGINVEPVHKPIKLIRSVTVSSSMHCGTICLTLFIPFKAMKQAGEIHMRNVRRLAGGVLAFLFYKF